MPEFARGDMWQAPPPDIYCITTNAMLNQLGHLIMGAGTALQAEKHYPGLAREFGAQLTPLRPGGSLCHDYYILIPTLVINPLLIAVQTKRSPWDRSDVELISKSLCALQTAVYAWESGAGRKPRVYLPYPGLGKGRLTEREVYPLVKNLPDYYTLWRRDD